MRRKSIGSALLVAGIWVVMASVALGEGSSTGRGIFERRCAGCHSLTADRSGPPLAGVVGRQAGAVPDFPYSEALKKSGIIWNEANLDRWLADPDSVV